jgi:nitroreductase
MKILALETSAKAVSAAVSEDGRILAAGYQDTGLTHSRTLMPIVEGILRNAGLAVKDMDAIAAAVGPGSFTVSGFLPLRVWRSRRKSPACRCLPLRPWPGTPPLPGG